jgi:hypothetical protein
MREERDSSPAPPHVVLHHYRSQRKRRSRRCEARPRPSVATERDQLSQGASGALAGRFMEWAESSSERQEQGQRHSCSAWLSYSYQLRICRKCLCYRPLAAAAHVENAHRCLDRCDCVPVNCVQRGPCPFHAPRGPPRMDGQAELAAAAASRSAARLAADAGVGAGEPASSTYEANPLASLASGHGTASDARRTSADDHGHASAAVGEGEGHGVAAWAEDAFWAGRRRSSRDLGGRHRAGSGGSIGRASGSIGRAGPHSLLDATIGIRRLQAPRRA